MSINISIPVPNSPNSPSALDISDFDLESARFMLLNTIINEKVTAMLATPLVSGPASET